jgi:hypothetical protein
MVIFGLAALNDYGGPAVITRIDGGDFSFIGTYIEGWSDAVVYGSITGYLNNVEIYYLPFSVFGPDAGGGHPLGVWKEIAGEPSAIDTLVISGGTKTNNYAGAFLLDNTQLDVVTRYLPPGQ